ncbi:hypothetical protein B0I35DRAFT_474885 [Stachybotrys elegans]|uniref:GATA-type domain-containing protein n=1 Tax=Stachybotrys elegans TaxID=80388 RepID=A0A8K0WVI0_9HYPO|nr:hypothetical protein B0I35DRAFT_474885 [Stachybotrys elegans]
MAAATVLAPGAHYHPPSSYSVPHPQSTYSPHPSGPAPSISNMISTNEPRKPVEGSDLATRQSLPPLSEVISGTKPNQYPPSGPPSMQPGSSLPSPYVPAVTRHYPDADKHSPQQIHSAAPYPPRQEPLPAFVDSPRGSFNGRPGLPPVNDARPSPPLKHEVPQHHVPESQKPGEPHPLANGYSHPPPPVAPYGPGQFPPGQVPLPAGYPISPRHAPHHMQAHYDPRGPPVHPDDAEYARSRYDAPVNRHIESWGYQDSLSRIGSAARTIFTFAEAYGRIAQEQQGGSHHGPDRLPTEREMAEMLLNADLLKRSLEQMRELVVVTIQNERAREGIKPKGPYEEDPDVTMYTEGGKPAYPMAAEVKKRRGRAAPPGRCHSCNRIDTPEWRRGPDGARTLCNACGLHYAKLERKRQLEARSIRPKPEERG